MNQTVKVSKAEFTEDVNNGMKREELMTKYGLKKNAVNEIAKTLKVTIKRSVKPTYLLVDEVNEKAVA